MACSQLAYTALGRMGPGDCRGACSSTAGCKVWQYAPRPTNWTAPHNLPDGVLPSACYIHDGTLGTAPVCTASTTGTPYALVGGRRDTLPPAVQDRKGVTWADTAFDDSSWSKVDIPHDFIVAGTYAPWNDMHHGYLPRDRAGWYRKHFRLPAAGDAAGTAAPAVWLHFEGTIEAA